MKAVVQKRYGGPQTLQVEDVKNPKIKADEILVKIEATSITAASTFMREGKPYMGRLFIGLRKPKNIIPGTDLAGEIISVGNEVSLFKKGDRVMASTDIKAGAYAEFIVLKEDDIITKAPLNITPEEVTGIIDGGCTALAFLKEGVRLKKGQEVLIYGASGSIGLAAIQIAQYLGAKVTAVTSTKNMALVQDLAHVHVVDYTKKDWQRQLKSYDYIFDTVGKWDYCEARFNLKKNGAYLTPVLSFSTLLKMWLVSPFSSKKLKFMASGMRSKERRIADLIFIRDMLLLKRIKTIVDRVYHLEDIVEAHKYVDTGRKRGNVILKL